MPEVLTDPISRLMNHLNGSSSRRFIIALAGYPGSGKSTISKRWAREIKGRIRTYSGSESFLVLGMDGFHLSKKRLRSMENPEEALARRGAPYTFTPEGLLLKMMELRNAPGSNPVSWPGFDHGVGDPEDDALTVPAACRVVLIEGIYTLYREGIWAGLEKLFDETWFLDVSVETAMSRLYKRHMTAWGMSKKEARNKADSNDRLNCAHITPGRENADFLVC